MGHTSSKEVRHEPPNPRRLSKPATTSSSFNITQPKATKSSLVASQDQHPLDESMFWKSPWTGDLLPKVIPETDLEDHNRSRSFPSISASQPDSPLSIQGSKRWSSLDEFVLTKQDSSLSRSSSYISRRLSRKSSNTRKSRIQPQGRKLALRETRKEPVIYFGPSDIGDHDLHSSIENLAVEDRSPVENFCIPPSRRQSFRRPSIATRTPSWGLHRSQLSSIQQEDEKEHLDAIAVLPPSREQRRGFQEEEEYKSVYSSDGRPTSPVALDYSHLSGFKKGTLRIVNGSASPASSDRIRLLTTPRLAGELPGNVYAKQNHAMFTSDANYRDEAIDAGDSDFSSENHDSLETRRHSLETCGGLVSEPIHFTGMEKTQSITNVDSGYSSISSVRSDNSSGQSSSPPMDSPAYISSVQPEGEGLMDKGGYFYSHSNKNDFNSEDPSYHKLNQSSLARENDSVGHHSARLTENLLAERPRFYALLGNFSFPPVPEDVGIDDRESDSEKFELGLENDGSEHDDCSPILPKSAFNGDEHIFSDAAISNSTMESISRSHSGSHSHFEHKEQAVATCQKAQEASEVNLFLTPTGQSFDEPRGRPRSRSMGRAQKMAKNRQVFIQGSIITDFNFV